MTNIGITGGRDYMDYATLEAVLDAVAFGHTIHVGDASGVDAMARSWALINRVPVQVYRADWAQYGKAAGPIRNKLIVDKSDVLYAFPGGRGTTNCIETAKRAGIPVWRVS